MSGFLFRIPSAVSVSIFVYTSPSNFCNVTLSVSVLTSLLSISLFAPCRCYRCYFVVATIVLMLHWHTVIVLTTSINCEETIPSRLLIILKSSLWNSSTYRHQYNLWIYGDQNGLCCCKQTNPSTSGVFLIPSTPISSANFLSSLKRKQSEFVTLPTSLYCPNVSLIVFVFLEQKKGWCNSSFPYWRHITVPTLPRLFSCYWSRKKGWYTSLFPYRRHTTVPTFP